MSENENGSSQDNKKAKKGFSSAKLRAAGAVLSLLQAVTAALFIYLLNGTGMIPWKYIMICFYCWSVSAAERPEYWRSF